MRLYRNLKLEEKEIEKSNAVEFLKSADKDVIKEIIREVMKEMLIQY